MRTERFFVPAEWIASAAKAFSIPAGNLHKQIISVLRMKAGDKLSLLTNDGAELDCVITDITRSSIMGNIVGSSTGPVLTPRITVCAAITKRDHFEWTLEKCTELGATEFIPLLTDRVIKRSKEISQRWHTVTKEASEQSGRFLLPEIIEPMSLTEALKRMDDVVKIAMHENGGASIPKIHKTSEVALFVGPEGGFTDEEIESLKKAGAHIVTFGTLVFRAETAAVVGLTMLRFGHL